MRLPKRLPAALAGLVLCAASAAEAGLPTVSTTGARQPQGAPAAKARKRHLHLCPECAAKVTPPPPPMMAPGSCPTCGPTVSGLPPGAVIIGEGTPSPVPIASAPGGAPGYAVIGGAMPASEPAPVGVMRTNYN